MSGRRDKCKTSANACGPEHPEWKTKMGNKCERPVRETSGRQENTRAAQSTQSGRQKWKTSVRDKCGRQVGDKRTPVRLRAPRVEDKSGRQVGDKCKSMRPTAPRVGEKSETRVKPCGPENSE